MPSQRYSQYLTAAGDGTRETFGGDYGSVMVYA